MRVSSGGAQKRTCVCIRLEFQQPVMLLATSRLQSLAHGAQAFGVAGRNEFD